MLIAVWPLHAGELADQSKRLNPTALRDSKGQGMSFRNFLEFTAALALADPFAARHLIVSSGFTLSFNKTKAKPGQVTTGPGTIPPTPKAGGGAPKAALGGMVPGTPSIRSNQRRTIGGGFDPNAPNGFGAGAAATWHGGGGPQDDESESNNENGYHFPDSAGSVDLWTMLSMHIPGLRRARAKREAARKAKEDKVKEMPRQGYNPQVSGWGVCCYDFPSLPIAPFVSPAVFRRSEYAQQQTSTASYTVLHFIYSPSKSKYTPQPPSPGAGRQAAREAAEAAGLSAESAGEGECHGAQCVRYAFKICALSPPAAARCRYPLPPRAVSRCRRLLPRVRRRR